MIKPCSSDHPIGPSPHDFSSQGAGTQHLAGIPRKRRFVNQRIIVQFLPPSSVANLVETVVFSDPLNPERCLGRRRHPVEICSQSEEHFLNGILHVDGQHSFASPVNARSVSSVKIVQLLPAISWNCARRIPWCTRCASHGTRTRLITAQKLAGRVGC